MTRDTILTSGPPLAWDRYAGGQREAIIGGAQFEGLAETRAHAEAELANGRIRVARLLRTPGCRLAGRHLHRLHAGVSDVASACI